MVHPAAAPTALAGSGDRVLWRPRVGAAAGVVVLVLVIAKRGGADVVGVVVVVLRWEVAARDPVAGEEHRAAGSRFVVVVGVAGEAVCVEATTKR